MRQGYNIILPTYICIEIGLLYTKPVMKTAQYNLSSNVYHPESKNKLYYTSVKISFMNVYTVHKKCAKLMIVTVWAKTNFFFPKTIIIFRSKII